MDALDTYLYKAMLRSSLLGNNVAISTPLLWKASLRYVDEYLGCKYDINNEDRLGTEVLRPILIV